MVHQNLFKWTDNNGVKHSYKLDELIQLKYEPLSWWKRIAKLFGFKYSLQEVSPEVYKEKLKEKKFNIEAKNSHGKTPITQAIYMDFTLVKFLAEAGANVNVTDNEGKPILARVINVGTTELIELFFRKGARNLSLFTALDDSNSSQFVQEVIRRGVGNLNESNSKGCTALHLAIMNNRDDIVELLIQQQGVDFNIQDNNGNTPLHLAIMNNRDDVVELLVQQQGANLNIRNNNGDTALHLAVTNNRDDVVELLINQDPDLDIQNNDGNTPLHLAAENGRNDVVELLINQDPDLDIQNNDKFSPLQIILKSIKSITLDEPQPLEGEVDVDPPLDINLFRSLNYKDPLIIRDYPHASNKFNSLKSIIVKMIENGAEIDENLEKDMILIVGGEKKYLDLMDSPHRKQNNRKSAYSSLEQNREPQKESDVKQIASKKDGQTPKKFGDKVLLERGVQTSKYRKA